MRQFRTDEAFKVHGRADRRDPARAGSRSGDGELCRKHGVSSATFYKWKARYGGLDVSDAKRLKALEDENRKLKKLLAEAMLDNGRLKELLAKKW
jgi:putative transposase